VNYCCFRATISRAECNDCAILKDTLQRKKNMQFPCSGTSYHCISCVNSVRDAVDTGAIVGDQSQHQLCHTVKKCHLNGCAVQCPVLSLASRIDDGPHLHRTQFVLWYGWQICLQELIHLRSRVIACYKPTFCFNSRSEFMA
jgi:hypothetical protein